MSSQSGGCTRGRARPDPKGTPNQRCAPHSQSQPARAEQLRGVRTNVRTHELHGVPAWRGPRRAYMPPQCPIRCGKG